MGQRGWYALAASLVLGYGMCGCVAPTVDVLHKPMWRLRAEERARYPSTAAIGKLPPAATHATTNMLYRWEAVPSQEQEIYLCRLEEQQRRAPSIEEHMYRPLRNEFPTEPRGISILRFRW